MIMHGATFDISIDLLEIISRQYCWILSQCNPYKTRLFAFSIYTKWFRMRCIRMQPPTIEQTKSSITLATPLNFYFVAISTVIAA